MRIVKYDGVTALVEIFLLPGIISGQAVQYAIEKFEYLLAELSEEENLFLKEVFKKGDYFSVVAIETDELDRAIELGKTLEKRTKKLSNKLNDSVMAMLNRLH